MKTEMTKEKFLAITIDEISQVYCGGNHVCRCGCKGDYVATSHMINPRSEVNDKLVRTRLNRAKLLIEKGAEYEIGSNHINIVVSEHGKHGRALTFYFDEVKNK